MPRRRRVDISADTIYFSALGLLLAASVLFTISVESRRNAWSGGADEVALPSGTVVELVRVIDGDEASVKPTVEGAEPFVVRLLGVKAFDANLNDPGLAAAGQTAMRRLKQRLQAADGVVLHYEKYQLDRVDRLLGYLDADELDVGLALVSEGAALAYTKYPHPREAAYVEAQQHAKQQRVGLWGTPEVAARAEALAARWAVEASE